MPCLTTPRTTTQEQLPNGGVRRYRYDALGRQVAREDEHGALTHYHWDAVGRLVKMVLPGGAIRELSYNPYAKVIAERDELGRVTRYEYADGLHLISRRINPDGTALRYRYDNTRLLLTEIENEAGELYQLKYYANGLIQQETGFDGKRPPCNNVVATTPSTRMRTDSCGSLSVSMCDTLP